MADIVVHNTRSRDRVVTDVVLGAECGGAKAFPSSGRDDKPGLTQTPTPTLSFRRKRRTERGPSMFGAQGPQAGSGGSNHGSKVTREGPRVQGTGTRSVESVTGIIDEGRLSTIDAHNVGLLRTIMPPNPHYATSSSSSDSEGESSARYEVTTPWRSPAPSRIEPRAICGENRAHLDLLRRAYPPRGTAGSSRQSQYQATQRRSHASSHSRVGSTRDSRGRMVLAQMTVSRWHPDIRVAEGPT